MALGSSHMAAVTTASKVFTWGLNTSQQLGHSFPGGTGQKYILIPTEPEIVGLGKGEKALQVAAGAHCTFLVTTQGRVYSWGSTENGLLGYPTETPSSPARCVEALAGIQVSHIVCGRKEVLAFVPRVITSVTPTCATQGGGTSIVLGGLGFPKQACACQVLFSLGNQKATVEGKYEGGHGVVRCTAPAMDNVGEAALAVSFDGAPYSMAAHSSVITICAAPEWGSVAPKMGPTTGDTEVTIEMQHLHESSFLCARVVGASQTEVADLRVASACDGTSTIIVTMPAWSTPDEGCFIEVATDGQVFFRVPTGFAYYEPPVVDSISPACMPHDVPTTLSLLGRCFFDPPEDGQLVVRFTSDDGVDQTIPGKYRILGDQQEVLCEVPPWERGSVLNVAVSFNAGQDYTGAADMFRAYEPIEMVKTVPSCGPMDGGTAVLVRGLGIFDVVQPWVRLTLGEKEMFVEALYKGESEGKGCIQFIAPVWRDPPLTPDPNAEAAEEPPPLPESTEVSLAFALNGKNFQPVAKPYTFYEEPVAVSSVTPAAAVCGDEAVFTIAGERIYSGGEDMSVKLTWTPDPPEGEEPAPVTQVVPVCVETVDEAQALQFRAPEAMEGEATLQLAVNGQQYTETELKITWAAAP